MSSILKPYRQVFALPKGLRWALIVVVSITLLGDFICNEKPLFCKINGNYHFPIFRAYAVNAALTKWPEDVLQIDWRNANYEAVIRCPIPYSYHSLDLSNIYKSPFEEQLVPSLRWRHWMGTDQLGRDTFAGLISGLRIAILVGLLTVLIAAMIGIPYGLLCGYFGDSGLRLASGEIVFILLGLFLACFYSLLVAPVFLDLESNILSGVLRFLVFVFFLFSFQKMGRFFFRKQRTISFPLDFVGQKIIEVIDTIPAIFFILAIMAILKPSIVNLIMVMGLLSWTGIARLTRAEMLRIRALPYIESAKATGLNTMQIIWRHALPNAISPVIIVLGFSVGGMVIVEAFLSFLGFGVSADQVSWGSMLNQARINISAWWLALFPGLAIFFTVLLFNNIGSAYERKDT